MGGSLLNGIAIAERSAGYCKQVFVKKSDVKCKKNINYASNNV